MTKLTDYENRYETARFERSEGGILQLTFHVDGGPWMMGGVAHAELPLIFRDVAADLENEVVILAGTGDRWSGPVACEGPLQRSDTKQWEMIQHDVRALMENYLAIPVPVISAINGPAPRQAQVPLLADIVLASETAEFQDSSHYPNSAVPGDGINIAMLRLLGLNRGRYFLLTGQVIGANEAKELGLVNEVLPPEQVLPRAWELARLLMAKNRLVRRYTRTLLTHELRGALHDMLGFGLALEGLGLIDHSAELGATETQVSSVRGPSGA